VLIDAGIIFTGAQFYSSLAAGWQNKIAIKIPYDEDDGVVSC